MTRRNVPRYSFFCVTGLVPTCAMSYSCVWHGSLRSVVRLREGSLTTRRSVCVCVYLWVCVCLCECACVCACVCVWPGGLGWWMAICVTLLIFCDMTRSKCVTWPIHTSDMTHPYVTWLILDLWHDALYTCDLDAPHLCDILILYAWHDSFVLNRCFELRFYYVCFYIIETQLKTPVQPAYGYWAEAHFSPTPRWSTASCII